MTAEREIKMFVSYMVNVKNRSPKTVQAYSSDLHEFFSVFNDRENIGSITRQDVESVYISYLVDAGNCASSRARKLSAVRSFFKWAKANCIVVENPVENVEMPKIPHKEPKVMTDSEVESVMLNAKYDEGRESACEGFRNLALVSLMFNAGLRRSEVTEIKLSDLDLEAGSLLVHGKGSKERTVFFNNTVRALLSEYVASHRKALKPAETSEYLFVSKRAEKLSPGTINKILDKLFVAAGVKEKGFAPHSARRTYATKVYSATRDIMVVKELLGHSNPQTTQRYVSVNNSIKQQAAMTVNF